MPANLERCVMHVMGKGHDKQSAFAICRSSMGLAADGSKDEEAGETLPDDETIEMEAKKCSMGMAAIPDRKDVTPKEGESQYGAINGPVVRKSMTVAFPIGYFKNGPQEGEIDAARLKEIVANTKKRGKPVPIFNLIGKPESEHPENIDQWPADGWAESLSIGPRGELVADSKIHGDAARMVLGDMVRGASIGTKHKQLSYDGEDIGEVLDHIVLTNNPFMSGMNIAARLARGGDGIAYHFTALTKEAAMADAKDKKADEPVNLTEQVTALQVLLVEKDGIINELTKQNELQLAEIKAFHERPDLALAQKEIEKLKQHNKAEKVRRICANMMRDRQIDSSALRGWYDHDSDAVVLAGFDGSQFKGDLNLLEYHRASVKRNPGRVFNSGDPGDQGATGFTAEDKKSIEALGKDPELIEKTAGAKNFTEYLKRKKNAGKE